MVKNTASYSAKTKSQMPALLTALGLLLVTGALLFFAVTSSGSGKNAKGNERTGGLAVNPLPEKVEVGFDTSNPNDENNPDLLSTLSQYTDYFVPDASPVAPAEGDANPFE